MNRVRSLPWTQILLALLLLATVANWLEMRRVEKAVNDLYSEIGEVNSNILDESTDMENKVQDTNDQLQQMERVQRCMVTTVKNTDCLLMRYGLR